MDYQYLPSDPVEAADLLLLPVAYGESVSERTGTHAAPEAILRASREIEHYDEILGYAPMRYMRLHLFEPIERREAIAETLRVPQDDKLLITLGGDHSITPFVVDAWMPRPATVVFLDAHADLRTRYLDDPLSHATPAHRLREMGHTLLMGGLRSIYEEEADRLETDRGIRYYTALELQDEDLREAFLSDLMGLKGDVYLSIDMDFFDPSFVPGVGTPQPGGLDWYFMLKILDALFLLSDARVRGVDLVELIPDPFGISQVFAAKLLQKIIAFHGESIGVRDRPAEGALTRIAYE